MYLDDERQPTSNLRSSAKRRPERQLPVIQSAAMDLVDEPRH
jgi:hypothetical protein